MERQHGGGSRRDDRRWSVRVPAAAAGLVLVERALMDGLGSPVTLLRVLGDLGRPWADPVASVLALIALMAETLVAYGLVVLLLHTLCMLPGFLGRLGGRLLSPVTPVVVRRLLDLLVGGALLAQLTVAATPGAPPGHRWTGTSPAPTAFLSSSGSAGPATVGALTSTSRGSGRLQWPVDALGPVRARPTPRRSAAPLPPWLGGGPSRTAASGHGDEARTPSAPGHGDRAGDTAAPRHGEEAGATPAPGGGDEAGDMAAPRHGDGADDAAARGYTVEVGDTLWDIAAAHLSPAGRSAGNIDRYWRQIYGANRSVIGADPDLIHPGARLHVPPFRRAR